MQASTAPHVDITHYCFSQNAQSLEGAIDTVDRKTLFTEKMIVEKKEKKGIRTRKNTWSVERPEGLY